MKNEGVLFNGKVTEDTYGDFDKEMEMFNSAFADVWLKATPKARLHLPIQPTT
jgi:hypothetical protein